MDLLRRQHREGEGIAPSRESAKGGFLMLCAILSVIYLVFSFAMHAYADPPTSPYTPGETLSPTCSPTSTNCTVLPPLFSTTTLPMGAILYMSDNSGTVTAATTTLYWNASTSELSIGSDGLLGLPTQNGTTSLLLLGPNQLSGGNVSGTFIGGNVTSGYQGDWMNFELNSSSVFRLNASGSLVIASGTAANGTALFTIATTSPIFSVQSNGQFLFSGNGLVGGKLNVSGTITQAGIAISTATNTLSLANGAGFLAIGSSSFVTTGTTMLAGGTATGNAFTLATSTAATTFNINCTGSTCTFTIPNNTSYFTNGAGFIASGSSTTWNALNTFNGGSQFNTSSSWLQMPPNSTSSALLNLGSSTQQNRTTSTFIGINATSSWIGDFLDFEVNSSTQFEVTSAGIVSSSQAFITSSTITNFNFTNATSTGNLSINSISSTQEYINSSTIKGFTFLNATSTGNLQVVSLHTTTGAVTVSSTFEVQSTSTFLGRMEIGTTSFSGTSTALVICPISSQCTVSSTASTTKTVLWVGSTNDFATGTSIVAKGGIWAGQADVGEFIPVAQDDADYGQGDVVSNVGSSSVMFDKSQTAYDPTVAGVVTITAGLVAGGGVDHGSTVIALAGRVPVNVTMDNGQIHTGDFLTSSDIPGVAMRATQPGCVIGMALENDLGNPDDPNATSQVMMLVNPGWNLGSLTSEAEIASSSWALENASSGGAFIIDQFTAYVQAALAKLGLVISDGVATLQGIVANNVSTNQLCVQGTCVNGAQLSNLLNNSNSGNNGGGGNSDNGGETPAPPPGSTPAPASSSTSSGGSDSSGGTDGNAIDTSTIAPPAPPSDNTTSSPDNPAPSDPTSTTPNAGSSGQ